MTGAFHKISCCCWSMLLLSLTQAVPVSWSPENSENKDVQLPKPLLNTQEIGRVILYLNEEKLKKWNDEKIQLDKRWVEIFGHFRAENIPHDNLKVLIEISLSCSCTNAAVERIFSLGNDYWSSEKSQLSVKTLSAVLTVKLNMQNESCSQPLPFITNVTVAQGFQVCIFENEIYNAGQSHRTANPCETCICEPPGFSCSVKTCDSKPGCKALHTAGQCCPDYVCDCHRNGRTYANGEKVEEPNPCNVCYCRGGEIKCAGVTCYTRSDCEPHYVPGKCCPKYDHCPAIENQPRTTIRTSIEEATTPKTLTTNSDNTTLGNTASFEKVQNKDGTTPTIVAPTVGTLEIIEIYPSKEDDIGTRLLIPGRVNVPEKDKGREPEIIEVPLSTKLPIEDKLLTEGSDITRTDISEITEKSITSEEVTESNTISEVTLPYELKFVPTTSIIVEIGTVKNAQSEIIDEFTTRQPLEEVTVSPYLTTVRSFEHEKMTANDTEGCNSTQDDCISTDVFLTDSTSVTSTESEEGTRQEDQDEAVTEVSSTLTTIHEGSNIAEERHFTDAEDFTETLGVQFTTTESPQTDAYQTEPIPDSYIEEAHPEEVSIPPPENVSLWNFQEETTELQTSNISSEVPFNTEFENITGLEYLKDSDINENTPRTEMYELEMSTIVPESTTNEEHPSSSEEIILSTPAVREPSTPNYISENKILVNSTNTVVDSSTKQYFEDIFTTTEIAQPLETSTTENVLNATEYEITDNTTAAQENESSGREYTLKNIFGNYPKQETPEKMLSEETTTEMSKEGNSSPKKPDDTTITLAEILLRWLESKKERADKKDNSTGSEMGGSITTSKEGKSEETPVTVLTALTAELLKLVKDLPESVSDRKYDRNGEGQGEYGESREGNTRSIEFSANTTEYSADPEKSLDISSKDIENLAEALGKSPDSHIEATTHSEDADVPIHLQFPFTDESLAPVLSMISDQLPFLKVGEELPIYIEAPPETNEDRKQHHGIVVVPTTPPLTVHMVKVVDGVPLKKEYGSIEFTTPTSLLRELDSVTDGESSTKKDRSIKGTSQSALVEKSTVKGVEFRESTNENRAYKETFGVASSNGDTVKPPNLSKKIFHEEESNKEKDEPDVFEVNSQPSFMNVKKSNNTNNTHQLQPHEPDHNTDIGQPVSFSYPEVIKTNETQYYDNKTGPVRLGDTSMSGVENTSQQKTKKEEKISGPRAEDKVTNHTMHIKPHERRSKSAWQHRNPMGHHGTNMSTVLSK